MMKKKNNSNDDDDDDDNDVNKKPRIAPTIHVRILCT